MLRERGAHVPTATAIDSAATGAIAEVDGAADAEQALAARDRCKKLLWDKLLIFAPGTLTRDSTFGERAEQAESDGRAASAPAGAARRIARVIARLDKLECKCAQGWDMLASHTAAFARDAEDCIERFDGAGLDRAIAALQSAAQTATSIALPQPALMPAIGGDLFRHFGWSVEEQHDLQTVLLLPMTSLGVKRGDRAIEIDAEGVKLSSGLRLTRERIAAACVPANQVNR